MLTERSRMDGHLFADGSLDGHGVGIATVPLSSPVHPSSSPSCIHHRISKNGYSFAGVAIKYGAEVADIERINGLVTTDHQMFAHKSLQIPLLGKYPSTFSSI